MTTPRAITNSDRLTILAAWDLATQFFKAEPFRHRFAVPYVTACDTLLRYGLAVPPSVALGG